MAWGMTFPVIALSYSSMAFVIRIGQYSGMYSAVVRTVQWYAQYSGAYNAVVCTVQWYVQ